LEIVGNVYESDYYSTMAGNGWRSEGRSNYGRVDMTDRNGYGRKQALLLNCERVTKYERDEYV